RRRRRHQRRLAVAGGLVVMLIAAVTVAVVSQQPEPSQHVVTRPGPVTPPTTQPDGQQSTPPPPQQGIAVKDLTWISSSRGWALLENDLRTTPDGGQTWSPVGQPPAATGLRFANANIGYAFGPGLSMTTNGGKT